MPSPRPTARALAEDFLRWRAKQQRHHRPMKRLPSARWTRLADRMASGASLIAIFVAGHIGGTR